MVASAPPFALHKGPPVQDPHFLIAAFGLEPVFKFSSSSPPLHAPRCHSFLVVPVPLAEGNIWLPFFHLPSPALLATDHIPD